MKENLKDIEGDVELDFEPMLMKFSEFLKNKYVKAAVFIFICLFFYYLGSSSVDVSMCIQKQSIHNITIQMLNFTQ